MKKFIFALLFFIAIAATVSPASVYAKDSSMKYCKVKVSKIRYKKDEIKITVKIKNTSKKKTVCYTDWYELQSKEKGKKNAKWERERWTLGTGSVTYTVAPGKSKKITYSIPRQTAIGKFKKSKKYRLQILVSTPTTVTIDDLTDTNEKSDPPVAEYRYIKFKVK